MVLRQDCVGCRVDGFERPTILRCLTIIVGGEIELEGGIIRPHDPELILKSYLRGDVVYQDMRFREKTAQGKRCAPAGIVARVCAAGGIGYHVMGGDVELIGRSLPEDIGARLFALVDDHASVFPDLVPPVEAVDMVFTSGVVVEDSPPDAIIPP